MATPSPYASALGRLTVDFSSFLNKESFAQLLQVHDLNEMTKSLEPTPYGPELAASRASYQGAALLEIATNRLLVHRNRHAFDASPFAGRPVVGAYLRRWDIQNIELILASKAQGRPVTDTELYLVSGREIPAGLIAGVLTLDDFRLILQQPSIEAVATALVKFGYGQILLPLLEAFQRTHDIFPITYALEKEYYRGGLEAAKFFQGDEWVVRRFLGSEIDLQNVLRLLKAKDAELPADLLVDRWIDGGSLTVLQAQDLFTARGVPELVDALSSRYPSVAEGTPAYADNRSLTGYEAALTRDRAVSELKRMRTYPLSIGVIFAYLMLAELERADVRRIVFAHVYGVSATATQPLLVLPRL